MNRTTILAPVVAAVAAAGMIATATPAHAIRWNGSKPPSTTSSATDVQSHTTFTRFGPDLSHSPAPTRTGVAPAAWGSTRVISSGVSKYAETEAWSATSYADKCAYGYCSNLAPGGSVQAWGFHVGPYHHTDVYRWACLSASNTCKWVYDRTQNGGAYGYWTETRHYDNQELHGVF